MPQLALPDMLALGFTVLIWAILGWVIEHPPAARPSVSNLMKAYRHEWMAEFITRSPRVFDGTMIDSLRQGTSFFASASLIAVGGGLAIIGNPTVIAGVSDLPFTAAPEQMRLRGLLVVVFLVNALLKFIWANRLFGYCAIVMAAVPNDPAHPLAGLRAGQAADLNIHAAKSFNRGLRSIYFALAALGWLFGPIALTFTTLAVSAVLIRRDFASESRQIIMRGA